MERMSPYKDSLYNKTDNYNLTPSPLKPLASSESVGLVVLIY